MVIWYTYYVFVLEVHSQNEKEVHKGDNTYHKVLFIKTSIVPSALPLFTPAWLLQLYLNLP